MSKTTNRPEASHVDDLRKVFVQVTGSETPLTPGEVVQAHKGINSRYARELLATLQAADLIVNTEDPDDPDSEGFQPNAGIDDFEEWAGTATESKPATRTKDEGSHPCYCGCGENVPSKSYYRPGHDARHAGVLGRLVAEEVAKGVVRTRALEALSDLPSEKLVAKATVIADKAIERANKKSNGTQDGKVTVGKKTFNATKDTKTGEVVYYDGDEVKSASKTAAKTFKAE